MNLNLMDFILLVIISFIGLSINRTIFPCCLSVSTVGNRIFFNLQIFLPHSIFENLLQMKGSKIPRLVNILRFFNYLEANTFTKDTMVTINLTPRNFIVESYAA